MKIIILFISEEAVRMCSSVKEDCLVIDWENNVNHSIDSQIEAKAKFLTRSSTLASVLQRGHFSFLLIQFLIAEFSKV